MKMQSADSRVALCFCQSKNQPKKSSLTSKFKCIKKIMQVPKLVSNYKSYLQKGVLNEYLNYRNRFTYTGNFVFYGLTPSTEYEVIIQSRNKEGWSDASDIFRFSTRDRGDYLYILA
jgi:hypothetical protein